MTLGMTVLALPRASPHDRGVSAGEMADIEGIMQVADRHGIPVIEDCAQAHGAAWHDGRTQHQPALLATPFSPRLGCG